MKTRTYVLSLLVAAVLFAAGWTGSAQKPGRQTVQWEYMSLNSNSSLNRNSVRFNGDVTLNELGGQGWELVSVAAFNPTESSLGGTVFYFKRAKR